MGSLRIKGYLCFGSDYLLEVLQLHLRGDRALRYAYSTHLNQ